MAGGFLSRLSSLCVDPSIFCFLISAYLGYYFRLVCKPPSFVKFSRPISQLWIVETGLNKSKDSNFHTKSNCLLTDEATANSKTETF